jgi:putative SOS response-associated peptidase YedK
MCGRYELHTQPAAIALAFDLAAPPTLEPRYNIAPTQQVPIVRRNAGGANELVDVRWGLVPRWTKDPSIGARLINVRAETVADRFGIALRRHRCLLPADGFYEWKQVKGARQPIRVGMKDERPFGLAGLYERWLAPDGEVLDTCTVLTTEANALLRDIHRRMPLIIARADYARWLDPDNHDDVSDLFAPYRVDAMTWHRVSSRVNAVRNDDASLIVPLPETEGPRVIDEPPAEENAREKTPVQTSLL